MTSIDDNIVFEEEEPDFVVKAKSNGKTVTFTTELGDIALTADLPGRYLMAGFAPTRERPLTLSEFQTITFDIEEETKEKLWKLPASQLAQLIDIYSVVLAKKIEKLGLRK